MMSRFVQTSWPPPYLSPSTRIIQCHWHTSATCKTSLKLPDSTTAAGAVPVDLLQMSSLHSEATSAAGTLWDVPPGRSIHTFRHEDREEHPKFPPGGLPLQLVRYLIVKVPWGVSSRSFLHPYVSRAWGSSLQTPRGWVGEGSGGSSRSPWPGVFPGDRVWSTWERGRRSDRGQFG